MVSSPRVGDPLWPNWWCPGHGDEGVAKAAWSQPAGPGHVDAGGAIHGVAEGNLGEAPASMAAGGRGSPPGAWNGHMEIHVRR